MGDECQSDRPNRLSSLNNFLRFLFKDFMLAATPSTHGGPTYVWLVESNAKAIGRRGVAVLCDLYVKHVRATLDFVRPLDLAAI